jgi:hypothetical protein
MDAFAKQLAKQIKDKYPNEEDSLQVVNKVLGQLINTTHIQKVHSGGLAELEACRAIGLKWISTKAHGGDAVDSQGLHVELKCTGVKKSRGKEPVKCNINYVFPENVDVYQHFATSPEFAGGHYWVILNKTKSKVYWWVKITQQQLADYVKKQLKKNPGRSRVNFGSVICRVCEQGCARFDDIRRQKHACSAIASQ